MKYGFAVCLLLIAMVSQASDSQRISLSPIESLRWDRLVAIDTMTHASFCRVSLKLKDASNEQGQHILSGLYGQKFCTIGDFDGDGNDDLGFVYEQSPKEYPPCRSLLVFGYQTQTPEVKHFVIERAPSCNLQTFDPIQFSQVYGSSYRCEPKRADADTLVIYGEGTVTTLYTVEEGKTALKSHECYGGAD